MTLTKAQARRYLAALQAVSEKEKEAAAKKSLTADLAAHLSKGGAK